MKHQHPLLKCAPPSILVLVLVFSSLVASDPSDEQCLTRFYQSIEDPQNKLQNWSTHFSNPCNGSDSLLQGATCNNGRIFKLSLSNLSLKGSISPFLNNCTNLQTLDLSQNSLSGPIPPELYLANLGLLSRLSVFDVSDNELSGLIPASLGYRSGGLTRFNSSSFQGNKELYGYPLASMKNKGLSVRQRG